MNTVFNASSPLQFGKLANSQERTMMAQKTQTANASPDLSFVVGMPLHDLLKLGNLSLFKLLRIGPQLIVFKDDTVNDMKQMAQTAKRMGIPQQDTPILFLLNSNEPISLRGWDRNAVLDEVLKSAPSMADPWLGGLRALRQTPVKPANQQTIYQAWQNLSASGDDKTVIARNFELMDLLIRNSNSQDITHLGGNKYVLKLVIPGSQSKPVAFA